MTNRTSESTVETIELMPHAKARKEPCHLGESSGGSCKGNRVSVKPEIVVLDKADESRRVNRHCEKRAMRLYPRTPMFFSTKQASPAWRMRLQRVSAAGRVSSPIRTW